MDLLSVAHCAWRSGYCFLLVPSRGTCPSRSEFRVSELVEFSDLVEYKKPADFMTKGEGKTGKIFLLKTKPKGKRRCQIKCLIPDYIWT